MAHEQQTIRELNAKIKVLFNDQKKHHKHRNISKILKYNQPSSPLPIIINTVDIQLRNRTQELENEYKMYKIISENRFQETLQRVMKEKEHAIRREQKTNEMNEQLKLRIAQLESNASIDYNELFPNEMQNNNQCTSNELKEEHEKVLQTLFSVKKKNFELQNYLTANLEVLKMKMKNIIEKEDCIQQLKQTIEEQTEIVSDFQQSMACLNIEIEENKKEIERLNIINDTHEQYMEQQMQALNELTDKLNETKDRNIVKRNIELRQMIQSLNMEIIQKETNYERLQITHEQQLNEKSKEMQLQMNMILENSNEDNLRINQRYIALEEKYWMKDRENKMLQKSENIENNEEHNVQNNRLKDMSKEILIGKYLKVKEQKLNLGLKLLSLVAPPVDQSIFPTMENIRADFDTLRVQFFKDVNL